MMKEQIDQAFSAFEAKMPAMLETLIGPTLQRYETKIAEAAVEITALKIQNGELASQMLRLESLVEVLANRVGQMEAQQDGQERGSRANNTIMQGVSEQGDQGGHSVKEKVLELLPSASNSRSPAILEARRLGRPREEPGARPRPILVRFASAADKHSVLVNNSRTLRAQRIYLDDDLTPLQQRLRASKRDAFQALKGQGAKPFWRGERLFFYRNGVRTEHLPGPPPPPRGPPPPRPPPGRPPPPRSAPAQPAAAPAGAPAPAAAPAAAPPAPARAPAAAAAAPAPAAAPAAAAAPSCAAAAASAPAAAAADTPMTYAEAAQA